MTHIATFTFTDPDLDDLITLARYLNQEKGIVLTAVDNKIGIDLTKLPPRRMQALQEQNDG